MSERLKDKFCSILKKKYLLDGCAHYDQKLKNCVWNLLPLNLYSVSRSIERAVPNKAPQIPQQPFPFPAQREH